MVVFAVLMRAIQNGLVQQSKKYIIHHYSPDGWFCGHSCVQGCFHSLKSAGFE